MENNEIIPGIQPEMRLNDRMKVYLLETARWAKFLAIVGFVGMGLLVIVGLAFMVGFSAFNSLSESKVPIGSFGIIYILMAVLYIFPLMYLYRFAEQIRQGIAVNDEVSATGAFENLKSLFKYTGILTIVILGLYVLVLAIAIPLGIAMS